MGVVELRTEKQRDQTRETIVYATEGPVTMNGRCAGELGHQVKGLEKIDWKFPASCNDDEKKRLRGE